MDKVDCVIVGSGIVGLSCAYALANAGREVIIFEAKPQCNLDLPENSTEVIHSGIHYPDNSLKAKLCARGRELLIKYTQDYSIKTSTTGKLIVSSHPKEHEALLKLRSKAFNNDVRDIELLRQVEVQKIEAKIQCFSALLFPTTAIIDINGFYRSLLANCKKMGVKIICSAKVDAVKIENNAILIKIIFKTGKILKSNVLINAAGLQATKVANSIVNYPKDKIPKIYFAKTNYFMHRARSLFKHLIYPLSELGGLGIHARIDLNNKVNFATDTQWVTDLDFSVDNNQVKQFARKISHYFPEIRTKDLKAHYANIRPSLVGSGSNNLDNDFMISTAQSHGFKGIVNCFGIDYPIATAALGIGEFVTDALSNK